MTKAAKEISLTALSHLTFISSCIFYGRAVAENDIVSVDSVRLTGS